jgi:hypothetical protein
VISTTRFILIVCGTILVFALLIIGWAVLEARRGKPEHMMFWRWVKVGSAGLGLVGLLILVVNLEKTIRDTIGGKARDYAYSEYYDLKLYTTMRVSIVCARDQESVEAKNACGDFRNIDNGVTPLNIRDSRPYALFDWPRLPSKEIKDFMEEVNRRLSRINSVIPAAATAESFLDDERRINFLFLAAIIIIFALAGSIGEAVYQLTLEHAGRKATVKS